MSELEHSTPVLIGWVYNYKNTSSLFALYQSHMDLFAAKQILDEHFAASRWQMCVSNAKLNRFKIGKYSIYVYTYLKCCGTTA